MAWHFTVDGSRGRVDDLLDAVAAALSARRIAAGIVMSLPEADSHNNSPRQRRA
ncbi:MAG: DUF429 domain-containing protein [Actinobacteria bacterium]|nr:MAG: DUF429 domain-containing protein [Actinomycetota bacterium]